MKSYIYYGGSKLHFDLPPGWNLLAQGEPTGQIGCPNINEEISRALDHPIGLPRLEEVVKPGKTVILFDDMTRVTPAYLVFPELLKRLNRAGVKDSNITAICAIGSHPKNTEEQLKQKIGKETFERLSPRVLLHDCNSEKNIILGRTSYGSLIEINPLVYEADFVVGIGWSTPHLSSGFGGGSKIVMPGVSSFQSIIEHHIKWLANPKAALGVLEGNPFHEEQDEIARITGIKYKVDVTMNVNNEVIKAYAGDICEVSKVSSRDLLKGYGVPVPGKADVVISGSYPMDRGVQFFKAMGPAVPSVKAGGHIIMIGRNTFPEQLKPLISSFNNGKSFSVEVRDLMQGIINPIARSEGISAWYVILYMKNQIERLKITYVCEDMSRSDVEGMNMSYDRTIEEALKRIEKELPKADVTIFPAGSITIPVMQASL